MQKYRKNHLEMKALTLLKAAYKFLNTLAEQKSGHLNVILSWFSSSNSGFICFFLFCKSEFGLVGFLHKDGFFH